MRSRPFLVGRCASSRARTGAPSRRRHPASTCTSMWRRTEHGLLEEHGRVAERAVGLAHGLLERASQVLGLVDAAHPAPPRRPSRRWGSRSPGLGQQPVDVARRLGRLQHRHDRLLACSFRDLVAGHLEHAGGRADEGDGGVGVRQLGVLGEEPVPGVDRVGAGFPGDADDLGHVQVRARRWPGSPIWYASSAFNRGAESCGLRTGRRRRSSHQARRRRGTPDGDLTAIGDQDLREHAGLSGDGVSAQRTFRYRVASNGRVFARARSLGQFSRAASERRPSRSGWRLGVRSRCAHVVVDLDPQSDVSTGMDIQVSGHLNVADVLASPREDRPVGHRAPSGWARSNPQSTIDVMIRPVGDQLRRRPPVIRDIWKLEEALANVEADYELVLIDRAAQRPHRRAASAAAVRGRHRARPVLGRGGRPRSARSRDPPRALPACSRSASS